MEAPWHGQKTSSWSRFIGKKDADHASPACRDRLVPARLSRAQPVRVGPGAELQGYRCSTHARVLQSYRVDLPDRAIAPRGHDDVLGRSLESLFAGGPARSSDR